MKTTITHLKKLFFKRINVSFLISVGMFALSPFANVKAQGDLLIMPKRVIFEGSTRSENLSLANIGKDTATFIISFDHVKMNEDGSFVRITEPEEGINFADKNLRIFPRTVTLAPKEVQAVKVQVSKTNELAPGEYRTNLYFRAVHNSKPLGEDKSKNDSTVSVRIIPTFGISIPAIIRVGEPTTSMSISDATLDVEKDTIPFIKMSLNRSGNMSVYGDVVVEHISSFGKTTRVGIVNGIAVYTPNPRRIMKIKLNRYAGADLTSGKLKITYVEQSSKNKILAQQELIL